MFMSSGSKELYRLRKKLNKFQYYDLMMKITNAESQGASDIYEKLILPKIRQHGSKVVLKYSNRYYDINNKPFKLNNEVGKKLCESINDELDYEERFEQALTLGLKNKMIKKVKEYSLWINGSIYHLSDVMYGVNETNKEICNEWKPLPIQFDEKKVNIHFTMRTPDECKKFCNEWNNCKNKKDTKVQEQFKNIFIDFLCLKDTTYKVDT